MNVEEKISLFSVITQLALTEAQLLWTRYTTMLYANTGLIAILSFAIQRKLNAVISGCSIIGLILSIIWIQMIRLSSYYYQRWQLDADFLISSDDCLNEIVHGRIEPRLSKPTKISASQYGLALPFTFIIGWLLVIAQQLGLIKIF